MFGGDVLDAGQVRYRAGDFADFIVGAGAQAEFRHSMLEHQFTRRIQRTKFLNLLVRHPCIGKTAAVAEAPGLDLPCPANILSHFSRAELA